MQGRPQDLAGGAKNFFFRFGNLHVAKHGKDMCFVRGVRGHEVYFDQIVY